jgi:aldehyde dehydrogenase (NAD+)
MESFQLHPATRGPTPSATAPQNQPGARSTSTASTGDNGRWFLHRTQTYLEWMADILEVRSPYIDGELVQGADTPFKVEDPSTGEAFAQVDGASVTQYGEAIAAARRAFDEGPWPTLTTDERVNTLLAFADALEARRDLLVETIIAEAGCPRPLTEAVQVGFALDWARDMSELARSLDQWERNELPLREHLLGSKLRLSLRRYEPVGVVAAISAYNVPLAMNVSKVIPALAVGCTVVLRPSPLTPLSGLVFGLAAEDAGLPPGVLNVLCEAGVAGGQVLSSDPRVDLVSFTGSVAVGRTIAAQAAPTVKRLILELGGKSVQIHLPDVFENGPASVVQKVLSVFMVQAGQGCSLQTRVLVPEAHEAEVLDALAAGVQSLVIGDTRDRATHVGPLISRMQRDRVEALVADGLAAGGRLVAGGSRPDHLERGWYYNPTVISVDDNGNPLAQREVFGPVVTVQGYRDADEAVHIANDSEYGLSGGVYTADLAAGLSIAERVRTGTFEVNGGTGNAYAAIGGYKQSGVGNERGVLGIRAFQEQKHITVTSF